MGVSSLREITIGVRDLRHRTAQFVEGCGLTVLSGGPVDAMTAGRLFDSHLRPHGARLGRIDVYPSPLIRLMEVAPHAAAGRTDNLDAPGPLGISFTTSGADARTRLEASGISFRTNPVRLNAANDGGAFDGERLEVFGRSPDGDIISLIERLDPVTPYGSIVNGCSEPVHASFIVTNLDACLHFMTDVLEHPFVSPTRWSGSEVEMLFGLPSGGGFRGAVVQHPTQPTGRIVFIEFEKSLRPMSQTHALSPGVCRLRYDTADLHQTLWRVPGGGGSLVRGPASIGDPVLGDGLVAMVRSPFGVLIELWQTT